MRRTIHTSLTFTSAAQAPLLNLLISLAFGVGQIIVGVGMVIYSLRSGRWQQMAFFGLVVLGTLIGCSGLTELIVSGTELLAQTGSILTPATAAQIRGLADHTFAIASILVVLLAICYPAMMRLWRRRHDPTRKPH
jgi:hypothetical protein